MVTTLCVFASDVTKVHITEFIAMLKKAKLRVSGVMMLLEPYAYPRLTSEVYGSLTWSKPVWPRSRLPGSTDT